MSERMVDTVLAGRILAGMLANPNLNPMDHDVQAKAIKDAVAIAGTLSIAVYATRTTYTPPPAGLPDPAGELAAITAPDAAGVDVAVQMDPGV